jgi:beta-fructofuranosidase
VQSLLWTPKAHLPGDIHIVRVGDEYHLFTEQTPLGAEFAGTRTVGHAVSKDLFHWEELPACFGCGAAGEFDAYTIYHMGVHVHEGRWYMHYTGLDKPGPGQQQAIGLAISEDGIHWTKHPGNPVLRADLRYYEPAIPQEATYQKKDFGRLWFRDPFVIQNAKTREFGMIVMARDLKQHPDVRGCLSWATSKDLVHWQSHPPIYSPGRFHTIETPSLFEHNGRHYIIYMTHPAWGAPILATDPYQTAGDFYAIAENGWTGPYLPPEDEVLVAAHGQMRMGGAKIVDAPNGDHLLYGWLVLLPRAEDANADAARNKAVPPPRRVRFLADGQMHVTYYDKIESFTEPVAIQQTEPVTLKNLGARATKPLAGQFENFIFSARVQFSRGERAGLALRASDGSKTGLYALADRRYGRIEFGTLDNDRFMDARVWKSRDRFELKIIAYGPSIEVYVDDRLMIHNVRHRETSGAVGYIVEHAEASFNQPRLRRFTG